MIDVHVQKKRIVEVVSPDDDAEDLLRRVRDYFKAGSREVWVIYPQQQELHRYYEAGQSVEIHLEGDTMDVSHLSLDTTFAIASLFVIPDLE